MQRLAERLDAADAVAEPAAQADGMTRQYDPGGMPPWLTLYAKKPAARAAGIRHLKRRLKEPAPCSAT